MALGDLLDALHGLSDWPQAPRGRDGIARRAVDWAALLMGCLSVSLAGAALLIGVFGAVSVSSYVAFAASVLTLLAAALVALFLAHLVASLIALGVDRLVGGQ